MKGVLQSRFVDRAMRGAALVVTDRRWAAPLSAAALGFGIFAGVAIGPGTAGSLATGAQQIIEMPSSGGGDGQSGGGGGSVASTESAPSLEESEGSSFEEAIPSVPLAPEAVEPLPAPTPEPAPKPTPDAEEEEEQEPKGQVFKGTVVHVNPAAGSYAMAIKGGELVAVHAPDLPDPGSKLTVSLQPLANGTFAEVDDAEAVKGKATEVSFGGTVTFADPNPVAPSYTVSGRGASLLVQVEPDPTGIASELPAIGSLVKVTARIEQPVESKAEPTLTQSKVEVESIPPSTYLELAGIVREVLTDGHLLISADDAGESESNLKLTIPPSIDASKLKPGDSYLATATLEPDSSLTLSGIASDERSKGANDHATAQGDLKR